MGTDMGNPTGKNDLGTLCVLVVPSYCIHVKFNLTQHAAITTTKASVSTEK